jgi:hypothetical protein
MLSYGLKVPPTAGMLAVEVSRTARTANPGIGAICCSARFLKTGTIFSALSVVGIFVTGFVCSVSWGTVTRMGASEEHLLLSNLDSATKASSQEQSDLDDNAFEPSDLPDKQKSCLEAGRCPRCKRWTPKSDAEDWRLAIPESGSTNKLAKLLVAEFGWLSVILLLPRSRANAEGSSASPAGVAGAVQI